MQEDRYRVDGVFIIPNDGPLDLTRRIVNWGLVK